MSGWQGVVRFESRESYKLKGLERGTKVASLCNWANTGKDSWEKKWTNCKLTIIIWFGASYMYNALTGIQVEINQQLKHTCRA